MVNSSKLTNMISQVNGVTITTLYMELGRAVFLCVDNVLK